MGCFASFLVFQWGFFFIIPKEPPFLLHFQACIFGTSSRDACRSLWNHWLTSARQTFVVMCFLLFGGNVVWTPCWLKFVYCQFVSTNVLCDISIAFNWSSIGFQQELSTYFSNGGGPSVNWRDISTFRPQKGVFFFFSQRNRRENLQKSLIFFDGLAAIFLSL